VSGSETLPDKARDERLQYNVESTDKTTDRLRPYNNTAARVPGASAMQSTVYEYIVEITQMPIFILLSKCNFVEKQNSVIWSSKVKLDKVKFKMKFIHVLLRFNAERK
jgi:hypothetical protein